MERQRRKVKVVSLGAEDKLNLFLILAGIGPSQSEAMYCIHLVSTLMTQLPLTTHVNRISWVENLR